MAVLAHGVDYSWARPDPECLRRHGYSFVVRYVVDSPTNPGKRLSKSEADQLRAAGLRIVSNFELTAKRPLEGYEAGAADARIAIFNTEYAGGPDDAVIYFSVDWDATTAELTAPVAAYFRGVLSVLPVSRVGVYGGYRQVRSIVGQGLAQWIWQTYAWSGGSWDSRAHIRQVQNNVTVCGGLVDRNEAHSTLIGVWDEGPEPMLSDLNLY